MGYPKRLLTEGEEIVFDLRPHWKVLVAPSLLALVIVFGGSFGIARVPEGSAQGAVRLVALGVVLLLLVVFSVWPVLKWWTTHFVVTSHRVIMREGLLARSGRDIPMFRINDVTFTHTVVERLFGAGTLVVESAGERGQVTLHDIPHVEHVQREIYELIEADDRRRRGDEEGATDRPPSDG